MTANSTILPLLVLGISFTWIIFLGTCLGDAFFLICSFNLFNKLSLKWYFGFKIINKIIKQNNRIFIIGNGGSSSIASHVSVDFAKVARIRSSTFNNSNLITCFANDYKYENWVTEAIKVSDSTKQLLNKNNFSISRSRVKSLIKNKQLKVDDKKVNNHYGVDNFEV